MNAAQGQAEGDGLGADLCRGRFRARFAMNARDLDRVQALRYRCFFAHLPQTPLARDSDRFDDLCQHILVEDECGRVLATLRMQLFATGRDVRAGYAAQSYGLDALTGFRFPMLELGRFCLAPSGDESDALRLAWALIARYVDENRVKFLFGCSSFAGLEPQVYAPAWGYLAHRHAPPTDMAPQKIAAETVDLHGFAGQGADRRAALACLPPLLRSYLAMGGWVSDHAVLDRHLGTLHVFTGVEVAKVPPARARALRQIAKIVPQALQSGVAE